jgi:ABC-type nickel/cobalt efflux system permease component RcnA
VTFDQPEVFFGLPLTLGGRLFGLEEWLGRLGDGGGVPLAVAAILGLRHATDPDHLTAVSTLVLGNPRDGARRAGVLGLAWGIGHAATLLAFGLPVVLFRQYLPQGLLRAAEAAIGVVIILLAGRLLLRWARGYFHNHSHTHAGVEHSHPHVHEAAKARHVAGHSHSHAESLGRSPLAAFGIGLVHGLGGSAGVGILVVGAAASQPRAVAALVLFAGGTALSMALVSWTFGYAMGRQPVARRIASVVPLLAGASLLFGAWYALDALRDFPLLRLQ